MLSRSVQKQYPGRGRWSFYPVVAAARHLPGIGIFPCFVSAHWLWNGMEDPLLFTGAHIVCGCPGAASIPSKPVPVSSRFHCRRRRRLGHEQMETSAPNPSRKVDLPFLSKAFNSLSRISIDSIHIMIRRVEDALIGFLDRSSRPRRGCCSG